MDVIQTLIDEKQINKRINEIADSISNTYEEIIVIVVLKGAFMFASDLVKNFTIDTKIDFIKVSSYYDTKVTNELTINDDITIDIKDKDVLIIEDIIDTANTISYLIKHFKDKQPKSLKVCTLLDKPSKRQVAFKADYTCFEVEDHFIVGYGLDYQQKYRNLKYIGILE